MLKLFDCPATCSLATMITLEECSADYEVVTVDLIAGDQNKPEFRAINPKGRVPALGTDQGVLTENPAIMSYIAMTHPDAGMALLDDPFALVRMQSFNAYLASSLQPALAPLGHPERFSADPEVQQSFKPKVFENVANCLDVIEKDLLVGPWVLGERYSVADGYLFTFSELITRLQLDATRYPGIMAHRARMLNDRPAVRKVMG